MQVWAVTTSTCADSTISPENIVVVDGDEAVGYCFLEMRLRDETYVNVQIVKVISKDRRSTLTQVKNVFSNRGDVEEQYSRECGLAY